MTPNKIVFISDVHIGTREFKGEWFKDQHVKVLCEFLTTLSRRKDEVKDLVILGDFFENWICPVDQAKKPAGISFPPTIRDIIQARANAPIWIALRMCLRNLTNVFYVPGNHDMATTQQDLDLLRDPTSGKGVRLIPSYLDGVLLAEHGHAYAMFAAPDPVHDPLESLPLAYFVTRILASTDKSHTGPEAIRIYIKKFFEAASAEATVSESIINALRDLAGLKDSSVVRMGGLRPDLTLGEVKQKYPDVWECWTRQGMLKALNALRGELGALEGVAETLVERHPIVVLGHTHGAVLRYYPRQHKYDPSWPIRQIYANTGCFCSDRPTYVEATNYPDGKWDVRLMGVGYNSKKKLTLTQLDQTAIG